MSSSDLHDWNQQWRRHAGMVRCRSCQAQQLEELRNVLFVHADKCPYGLSQRARGLISITHFMKP